jgi:hypothetical protein
LEDGHGLVLRSPIDDKVFDPRVVLLEDALDRRADESSLIVRRCDDGDERKHHVSVSGAVIPQKPLTSLSDRGTIGIR